MPDPLPSLYDDSECAVNSDVHSDQETVASTHATDESEAPVLNPSAALTFYQIDSAPVLSPESGFNTPPQTDGSITAVDRLRATLPSYSNRISTCLNGRAIDRSRLTSPSTADGTSQRTPMVSGAGIPLNSGMKLCNGRYELKTVIGTGGMGIVYRAWDADRHEEVAVKALNPALIQSEKAIERFLTEGQISSELSHPNIVSVYDVQNDHDVHFIAMQLLEGRTLRQDMETRRTLQSPYSIKDVRENVVPICKALSFAHTLTVHRDVKPENVFLCEDGSVKLMDFGIARVQTSAQMTTNGIALGTAYYMAPEQLRTPHLVDHRADQFALAVIVYEMLSGELPTGRSKPLSDLRTDLPDGLSNAVDRAMAAKPDERFDSIAAFSQVLSGEARFKPAHGRGRSGLAVWLTLAALVALCVGGWQFYQYSTRQEMIAATSKAEITRHEVDAGQKAMDSGNWVLAQSHFQDAHKNDPANESAQKGLETTQKIVNDNAKAKAERDNLEADKKAELARKALEEQARQKELNLAAQKAQQDLEVAERELKFKQAQIAQKKEESEFLEKKKKQDLLAAEQAERDRKIAEAKEQDAKEAAAKADRDRLATEAAAQAERERIAAEAAERANSHFVLAPGEFSPWLKRTSGWGASDANNLPLRYRVYLDNSDVPNITLSKKTNAVLPSSKTIRFQAAEANLGPITIDLKP
ncbi:MAG: protein kinase [Planctomycetota bacterium]